MCNCISGAQTTLKIGGGGGGRASELLMIFMYPLTSPTVAHAWSLAAVSTNRPQKTAVKVYFHSLAHVWQ